MMRRAAGLMLGLALVALPLSLRRVQADTPAPEVELDADKMGPRTIEELTHRNIARDYGLAWQTMRAALERSRADALPDYFVGFALQKLQEQVAEQGRTGLRMRYVDRSHKLEGVFYSPDGAAMLLHDTADVSVQVLDGDKVLHDEQVTLRSVVLMTPGADRWQVRLLQPTPSF